MLYMVVCCTGKHAGQKCVSMKNIRMSEGSKRGKLRPKAGSVAHFALHVQK